MIIGRSVFNSWNDTLDPPRDLRLVWRNSAGSQNATTTNDFRRENWTEKQVNRRTTAIVKDGKEGSEKKKKKMIYLVA